MEEIKPVLNEDKIVCTECQHPKDQHLTGAICMRTQCMCQGFTENQNENAR